MSTSSSSSDQSITAREGLQIGSHLGIAALPTLFGGVAIAILVLAPEIISRLNEGQYSWPLTILIFAMAFICPILIVLCLLHMVFVLFRGFTVSLQGEELRLVRWHQTRVFSLKEARWEFKDSSEIDNAGDFYQIVLSVLDLFSPIHGQFVVVGKERLFRVRPSAFGKAQTERLIVSLEAHLGPMPMPSPTSGSQAVAEAPKPQTNATDEGPKKCRKDGCDRQTAQFSVFCEEHHQENLREVGLK